MGLFDIFSRKEDDAHKATLDELVRQTAAERTRIREDIAAIDARHASATAWLTSNRAAIVTDYGRLLDTFLTRDAASAGRAVAAAEDRLPVVASIPVYYSDGVTTVTFADMAAQIFPDNPGLAQRLIPQPGTLPATALTARKMEEFYKPDPTAMDARFLKDPDAVKKMSGNYRENVKTWTDHFRMVLDGLRINGPAEIARKQTAMDEFLRAELETISVAAGRHRALIDAFDRADADGVVDTLKRLKKSKTIADMLALGTGRADVADFTLMTLHSFPDPGAAARVYAEIVQCGQPLHIDLIAARVLAPQPTLPPGALACALGVAAAEKKNAAMALMLSRDSGGMPWLALAAHSDTLTRAVLSPANGDPALMAAALLAAADMTADGDVAGKLRARADALTVHGAFVTVAKNVRVRPAAVDYASYTDGNLRYNVNGEGWYDKMSEASGKATLRVLSARPDMLAVNESSVVNGALAMNVWNGKSGTHHVSAMTRSNTYGMTSATGDAATVIERFAARPGWIAAGNEAFNARAVDNAWPHENKQGQNIKFLGSGREYYGPVTAAAIDPVFDALIAEDASLERVGNEIVRMPIVSHASLVRDGDINKLDLVTRNNGDLYVTVSEEEGIATLKRLESAHGHVFISPWQTIAPSVVDNMRVQTKDAGKPALSVTLGGKSYGIPGIDVARAELFVKETVRLLPHFHEAAAGTLAVNMRHVDAVTLTGEGMKFITNDKTVTAAGNREIFARVVAGHGLLRITDKLAINPARINLMFQQDGKLTFSSGTGRVSLPVSAAEGAAIMDRVCVAPGPAKSYGMDAERKLSAAFACEPAWPVVVKKEEELCAPPPYSEKPSPR